RVGEQECGACARAVEWRLDGGLDGGKALDDPAQLEVEARQPHRERPLRDIDRATAHETRPVRRTGNDGPPGASGSGVDPQNAPVLRQDASSLRAASSNERFA